MKFFIINPPYDIERYMGKLSKVGWVFPPAGLLSLASFLESNGVQVRLYDAQVATTPLVEEIRRFRPDMVGITCTTALVYSMKHTAKLVKDNFDIPVVVGGVHPTVMPDETLGDPNVDFVVRGEGEITTYELLRALKTKRYGRILGLSYTANGKVVHNPPRPLIKNLDDLPYPAYHLIEFDKLRSSPDLDFGSRMMVVYGSRGCPYNCVFCANRILTNRRWRVRSVHNLMGEIDLLINKYGINFIMMGDNDFTVNREWAMEFCREYIKRGYSHIGWEANVRADQVDDDLLALMKKAGCRLILLGLESGVQRILDMMNKQITLEQAETAVKKIKKAGMLVRASFILGMPTETREESLQTIRFAKKLPLDQVRFAVATPFPGTELFDMAKQDGMGEIDDWTKFSLMVGYTGHDPVYVPHGRAAEEIKALQRKANLEFFLRPRIIWSMAKRIRSFRDVKKMARGLYHFMKATFLVESGDSGRIDLAD
ncbi:MAG: cobalamin-dependent protein [Candidatus Aenigmarchaeota archaeon]|nr:cobalamin-dependent protein [Candidatus Aenigmarchaeota archaeon]